MKKAAPQSHESAGHTERTVRAVKESCKTMLLDFQGMGYTLNFSREIVGRLLIYICMAHNNFRLVQGSSKTPREISVGKAVSKDQFALFGTKVLAELPDSILKQNRNLPRFSPAVFLHPDFASMGSVVMSKVRVGQELVIRTFIGKSLKLVLPIEIDNSFGLFVQLTDERSGLPVLEDVKEGGARVLPEGQGLSCPASGPPLKWIEENGITQGCSACKSIEIYGTRKSRVHSRKCCDCYEKWLAEQASVADLPIEKRLGISKGIRLLSFRNFWRSFALIRLLINLPSLMMVSILHPSDRHLLMWSGMMMKRCLKAWWISLP